MCFQLFQINIKKKEKERGKKERGKKREERNI